MKKHRQSNFELLRIIAMLLIISFHYVYKSGYVFEELTVNAFIVKTFYLFGELGVNLFILITGYFMIKGKFSFKKLICLILEVEFYYLFSVLLATKLGLNVSEKYILLPFPIIFSRYWFMTAYVLVYILSPYLNILIHNMEKRMYQKLLLISLLLWSILPTIFGISCNSTEKLLYYSRFVWFVIMYFMGAYIRLYPIKIFEKMSRTMICALINFGIMLVGILFIYRFKSIFEKIGTTEIAYFWMPNTIPMFMLSVSIFEIFLKIKMNDNAIINRIASTTLGVYLIHDGVLNGYLWNTIFHTKQHLNSPYSILYILLSTVIIFAIGALIDLLRQFIEKHTVKRILDSKAYAKLSCKVSKTGEKLLDKL